MNENKLVHMIDEMSLKYKGSMTDEPSEANTFCNTILNDFNKLKRTINPDLDGMKEMKKLMEKCNDYDKIKED